MSEDIAFDNLSRKTHELLASGSPQLALEDLKRTFPRFAKRPEFWILVGTALEYLGQPEQAAESYRFALQRDPQHLKALVALGLCLRSTQHVAESRDAVARALALDPNCEEALVLSVSGDLATAQMGDRRPLASRIRHLVGLKPKLVNLIRAAYFVPFLDIDYELEREIWAAIETAIGQPAGRTTWSAPAAGSGRAKLRIGYVSPNFGDHPIGHVTKSLYRSHDRRHFEVYLYSVYSRPFETSEYKTVIRESCDRFIDISSMDVRTAHARIVEDQIDILVDLNGYMVISKIIEIFARRPAPVQVYWLGHAGALGLSWYDYVIGDATVTPPEEDRLYVEKIARLPHTFHSVDRHEIDFDTLSRRDCGLRDDAFVFASFGVPTKIDPEVFDAWMQILHGVPGSQLWLAQGRNPEVERNLRRAAAERGIGDERLVFAARLPDKRAHLGRHRLADLALDTFTVNASTVALDALWAGLPILTRTGRHFCARNCTSFLRAVGLGELACVTTAQYIERAVHFGTHREAAGEIRRRLWANRERYPLFDTEGFTRQLENAYRTMWERHRSGQPPTSFSLPADR
ncbi:MAG: hypothetical protein AMXMBFR8_24000 [Nevskiales bacterium]